MIPALRELLDIYPELNDFDVDLCVSPRGWALVLEMELPMPLPLHKARGHLRQGMTTTELGWLAQELRFDVLAEMLRDWADEGSIAFCRGGTPTQKGRRQA